MGDSMIEKKVTTDDRLPGPQGVVTTNGTEPDIPDIEESTIPNAEPISDPPNIGAENRIRYFRENLFPYAHRMRNREYNALNRPLQVELIKLQNWIRDVGERVIILFEGRDAAGKGGTIRKFMEHWNPRHARVVALDRPSDVELGQWYFQRYVRHFPTAGEIVLFDRSWYNRAGVERVLGFSSERDYRLFIRQAPAVGANDRGQRNTPGKAVLLRQSKGATQAVRQPRQRSAQTVEGDLGGLAVQG